MGIKIYNKLPPFVKNASDKNKTFKILLKKFLYSIRFMHWMSVLIILQYRSWTCTVAVTKIESSNSHLFLILNDIHLIFC